MCLLWHLFVNKSKTISNNIALINVFVLFVIFILPKPRPRCFARVNVDQMRWVAVWPFHAQRKRRRLTLGPADITPKCCCVFVSGVHTSVVPSRVTVPSTLNTMALSHPASLAQYLENVPVSR